jgi:hypothetical protein
MKNGLKGGQVMPQGIVASIMSNRYPISKEMELVALLGTQWEDIWKEVVDQVRVKALPRKAWSSIPLKWFRLLMYLDR